MTAPFELKMTEQEAFDGLKKQFGTEFTTPEVRAFCAMNDIAYATVTRKIAQYKVGKGKWNLTVTQKVVDKIENSYKLAISSNTNIEPFNDWVEILKSTGYLHNHVRMWFASIWIFFLGIPWQLGAKFFYQNLLDGDIASNLLSWRWVAGLQTKGKRYIASEININK